MGLWKNTIRLNASFSTFEDVLADPTDISLNMYTYPAGDVVLNVSGSMITRKSVGLYYYDYTIPNGPGKYVYEWKGVLEGSDIVNRGTVNREFLKS
jgi:hypothetical protein